LCIKWYDTLFSVCTFMHTINFYWKIAYVWNPWKLEGKMLPWTKP
jgi:hypothetical protein